MRARAPAAVIVTHPLRSPSAVPLYEPAVVESRKMVSSAGRRCVTSVCRHIECLVRQDPARCAQLGAPGSRFPTANLAAR